MHDKMYLCPGCGTHQWEGKQHFCPGPDSGKTSIFKNAMAALTNPKQPKPKPLEFTDKEIKRLIEAVQAQVDEHADSDLGYESRAVQNRHLFVWRNLLKKLQAA